VRLEGLGKLKKIQVSIPRLVAKCLNHYAIAYPTMFCSPLKISRRFGETSPPSLGPKNNLCFLPASCNLLGVLFDDEDGSDVFIRNVGDFQWNDGSTDGYMTKSKSKLDYDRQSVGQSVLVSGTHLGPATNFSHSLFNYFF
jgi:hypothetical protein